MKNKIKKILIGLVCVLGITSGLAGCEAGSNNDLNNALSYTDATSYCDLECVAVSLLGVRGTAYRIFVDKNTGVCYLQLGREGITALLDAEGKPIIWEGFDESEAND